MRKVTLTIKKNKTHQAVMKVNFSYHSLLMSTLQVVVALNFACQIIAYLALLGLREPSSKKSFIEEYHILLN